MSGQNTKRDLPGQIMDIYRFCVRCSCQGNTWKRRMWLLGFWISLICLRMILASASENPDKKCFIIKVSTFASFTSFGQASLTSAATFLRRDSAFLMPLFSKVPLRSTLHQKGFQLRSGDIGNLFY